MRLRNSIHLSAVRSWPVVLNPNRHRGLGFWFSAHLSRVSQSLLFCILLSWPCYLICAAEPVHPLEPLSTNELRAAVEILLKESKVTTNTLFPIVTLQEPAKEKVLSW